MKQVVSAFSQPRIQPLGSLGINIERKLSSFSVSAMPRALMLPMTATSVVSVSLIMFVSLVMSVFSVVPVSLVMTLFPVMSVCETFLMAMRFVSASAPMRLAMFMIPIVSMLVMAAVILRLRLRNPIQSAPSFTFELSQQTTSATTSAFLLAVIESLVLCIRIHSIFNLRMFYASTSRRNL